MAEDIRERVYRNRSESVRKITGAFVFDVCECAVCFINVLIVYFVHAILLMQVPTKSQFLYVLFLTFCILFKMTARRCLHLLFHVHSLSNSNYLLCLLTDKSPYLASVVNMKKVRSRKLPSSQQKAADRAQKQQHKLHSHAQEGGNDDEHSNHDDASDSGESGSGSDADGDSGSGSEEEDSAEEKEKTAAAAAADTNDDSASDDDSLTRLRKSTRKNNKLKAANEKRQREQEQLQAQQQKVSSCRLWEHYVCAYT